MMKVESGLMSFPEVQYRYNKHRNTQVKESCKGKATNPSPSNLPNAHKTSGWNIPDDQKFHVSNITKMKFLLIQP